MFVKCSLSSHLTKAFLFLLFQIKLCSNVALAVRHAQPSIFSSGRLRQGEIN